MFKVLVHREKTRVIGKKIYYFKCLSSTQDFAKKIAEKEKEGTVVIADKQTKGRGRHNRMWFSPKGGVYLSIILKPDMPIQDVSKLTLLSCVAISNTIEKQANIKTSIKWPNDVLIKDKKIAGILTEGNIQNNKLNFTVVGIGINLNNKIKLKERILYPATSIREEINKEIEKEKFIENLLFDFDKMYTYFKKNNFSKVIKIWKNKTSTLGNYVTVLQGNKKITGLAIDIDEDGFLILKDKKSNIVKVITGDIV